VLPSVAPGAAPYAPPAPAPPPRLFDSFLMAGFECSTHVRRDGTRLDLVALSGHDRHAAADYARCRALGIRTARDGVRWHLGESPDGRIAVAHEVERVRAARDAGVQVIWDLWHYGTPDHLDVLAADFPSRLARWARAFAELVAGETDAVPLYTPVNEISFVAWGGGDVGYLNPFRRGRGAHLKRQLARAAIEVTEAVWAVDGRARVCHVDPVIHVSAAADRPQDAEAAEAYRQSMYEAWDLIAGRQEPWLGGSLRHLDVVGVNFYPRNQWVHAGPHVGPADPGWRPLDLILAEVHARYGRPVFVAETGCEFEHRAGWLRGIGGDVRRALDAGVPVEGLCWYPIVNHPGWDDDRHLQCGLWDYPDADGGRAAHDPLLAEWTRQRALLPS
jgi:hypothetical protein